MKITSEVNPTTEFTRIPNSVIFDENLTAVEFRTWCQLLAMPKGRKEVNMTAAKIAEAHGTTSDVCRDRRRSLKAKGYLSGSKEELVVTMPDDGFTAKEPKTSPAQDLRHKLNEVWNEWRPKTFCGMRLPLSAKQLITLKEHSSNLKEENLEVVLKRVLLGCRADPWWKEKTMKFDNVFGTGGPTEKKFSNVEKLYKLGVSDAGQSVAFDPSNDRSWVDWFALKGSPEYTKIKRLEAADRFEALDNEIELKESGSLTGDTIRVYSDQQGQIVYWTGQNLPQFRYLP